TAPLPALDPESFAAVYLPAPVWTSEAGSLLGWLALALTVAASAMYSRGHERAAIPTAVGVVGLGLIVMLACTVERLAPGNGYRTLMFGLAGMALAGALTLARLEWPRGRRVIAATEDRTREIVLICLAGLPALALAVKAAWGHRDQLGAAG